MTFALGLPEKVCRTQSRRLRHVKFVLPPRVKNGQDARASSSLGALRKLRLTLFPQGNPRRGLTSQKVKCNYENENQT
jgi:hypothetical protein